MKSKWTPLIIILIIVAVLGISVAGSYNGMVKKNEEVKTMQGNIQAQLQRRADLVPNLVNTVKGYASHEKEIMDTIAKSRDAMRSSDTNEALKASDQLTRNINIIVERYPDLKASENFKELQAQLEGTENRIAVARRDYNNTVNDYNASIKKFPNVIFANMFGFKEYPYFEAAPGSDKAPEVKF